MIIFQVLYNLFLFVYLPYVLLRGLMRSKLLKVRHNILVLTRSISHEIKINGDLYTAQHLATLVKLREDLHESLKKPPAEREGALKPLETEIKKFMDRDQGSSRKELFELLVVTFAIVAGARALYAQPFKIPTASMEPTLFGVHLEETDPAPPPGVARRLFDYLNYSWLHPDAPAPRDCYLCGYVDYSHHGPFQQITPSYYKYNPGKDKAEFIQGDGEDNIGIVTKQKTLPLVGWFAPTMKAPIIISKHQDGIVSADYNEIRHQLKNNSVSLPGSIHNYDKYSKYLQNILERNGPVRVKKGYNLVNVRHIEGDHLFVDRVTYHFREPKRGDIAVFTTDYIKGASAGRYYIKRLVGLPGDELKVVGSIVTSKNEEPREIGKLYVRPKGEKKFVPLDGKFHPAFDQIYSGKNGYDGYTREGCFNPESFGSFDNPYKNYNFTFSNGVFKIPEGFYFMMGDNSDNSTDSRIFGPVPRCNIVGRALINYWPFSRRWGIANSSD